MPRKKHITIVNDHPEFLSLMTEFLTEEGYEISAIPKHLLTTMLIVMSGVKFTAVVLWFMHLKFDNRLFSSMFLIGLLLAMAIFTVVLSTVGGKLI